MHPCYSFKNSKFLETVFNSSFRKVLNQLTSFKPLSVEAVGDANAKGL